MHPIRLVLAVLVLPCAALAQGGSVDDEPWGYHAGREHEPRQGSFCDDRQSALEVADIFERFGAPTGFSALSNSPGCSSRVHGVTPRALLRRVRVPLESGGEYFVNFIEVRARDGSEPVLVTTRRFLED